MDDPKEPKLSYADHKLNPLASTTRAWCRTIKRSLEWKDAEFQKDADDITVFFNGTKDDMWSPEYATGERGFMGKGAKVPTPEFQMVLMKVADGVQIIGPTLYSRNPKIETTVRLFPEIAPQAIGINPMALQQQPGPDGQPMPPTPEMQFMQQAQMRREATDAIRQSKANCFKSLINYSQEELCKREHMRRIIDEALIMGMGCGWTEVYESDNTGKKLVGTFYDSVRNYTQDPDATSRDDIQWMARKVTMPHWEAEEKFQLPKNSLQKYARKSSVMQTEAADSSDSTAGYEQATGKTNDLITFWEVYSKMGIGDRLRGVKDDLEDSDYLVKGMERVKWSEIFGENCYLAICDNCPWPLNLHPDKWELEPEQLKLEAEWPIPFWIDDEWPMTPVEFHPVPDHAWPMSHFKPGLGELKWLTWAMSFLANKVRTSCGTTIGVNSSAADEIIPCLESNSDNRIIKITQSMEGKSLNELVGYLQQPPFHADIYNVIQAVMNEFDKRTGLSEILYGMSGQTQDRSATESQIKNTNATGRISDMTNMVEVALSAMCRKEALANRWMMTRPENVFEVLGPEGTQVWVQHVLAEPVERTVLDYDFSVVAGSTRGLDRQAKLQALMDFAREFSPVLQAGMNAGMLDPVNNIMLDVAKLMDIEHPERYQFIPPPPQPDPKVQAEMQQLQMKGQQAQESHQMEMQKTVADLQMQREEMALKAQEMEAKLAAEMQKAQVELQTMQQKAMLELQIMREKAQLQAQTEQMKAAVQVQTEQAKAESSQQIAEVQAASQIQIAEKQADAKAQTDAKTADAKIEQTKKMGDAQVKVAKAKAKATPKKPSGDKK